MSTGRYLLNAAPLAACPQPLACALPVEWARNRIWHGSYEKQRQQEAKRPSDMDRDIQGNGSRSRSNGNSSQDGYLRDL
jgi:hypothetical protein